MYFVNSKLKTVIVLLTLFLFSVSFAAGPFTMEISALRTRIKVGEPLIVNLVHHYQQPQIYEWMEKIRLSIRFSGLHVQIQNSDGEIEKTYRPMPIKLMLQDANGLEYKGIVDIFYEDSLGLVFDQPGTYNIRILSPSEKFSTNILEVVVEPASPLEEKALSFFTGREDFAFLMGGIFKDETRISHFEQVADQCGQTLLGKWAAARLGIEGFKEIEAKYPRIERFMYQYRKGLIKEPLVENSYAHLVKALELPDEFPIRQEVLDSLFNVEAIKGNNAQAISYANELSQKYPKGEFGKKVSVAKLQDEIVRLEQRMAKLAQERRDKFEELITWLEKIWLEDERIRETMDPNQWEKLMELLKGQTEN